MLRYRLIVMCAFGVLGCGDEGRSNKEEQASQVTAVNENKGSSSTANPASIGKQRYSFLCSRNNLSGSHKDLLRFYRNEIFARLGRGFKSKDLQQLYGQMSWYKVSSSYSDDLLTDEDKKCLEVIQGLEQSKSEDYPLYPPGTVLSPDLDGDGIDEKVSYDGLKLTVGKAAYSVNSEMPMNFEEEGASGAVVLLDLDMTDASRELLVVTDPGVTDELQFQIFGYKNTKIVPLMDKPEWVSWAGFKHLVGTLQNVYDNCGSEETLEWRLNNGVISKSTKTKKTNSQCAACPYVYTLTERMQRFSGEILKNQRSRDLYREDLLELGSFAQNEHLRVRLVELKPETTFLDSISIVVSDTDKGVHEQFPQACSQEAFRRYCLQ